MIEKVRLQNWKTHADSSFQFDKGTNVLIGQMGSGKSSVMDAVCFALFGTFPSLQSRKVSLEETLTNKPNKADQAFIELEFSYKGKKYRVERTVKRKGNSEAKIYCEGKFLAGPKPRDVNQEVEKAIEINYNLFSRAVYSEQNEIDYFLRLSPKDRKTKFDELLELQKYETVRGNAVTALNRLKAKAKDKRKWVEEQKSQARPEEEKGLKERILEKEKENKELLETIEKKTAGLEKLEKSVKGMEKTETEFRRLQNATGEKKAIKKQLEKDIDEMKKEAQKSPKEIEAVFEALEKEEKEKEKQAKETEQKLEKAREQKSSAEKQAALNQNKAEELSKHLQELQGLGAECPVCKQKLEEKTREALLEEEKKELKKAALEMEKALKSEAEAKARVKDCEKEAKKVSEEKEKLTEKRNALKQEKDAIKKLAEKTSCLEKNSKELVEQEEKLKKMEFDEKKLLDQRKKLVEENAAINAAKNAVKANQQLSQEMRKSLGRIEQTRARIKEQEKNVKAIEANSEKMNLFVNSLLASQQELRATLIATINQAMDSIWKRVYPYKDYLSAKMDVEQGNYELRVKDLNGNWVRVEGILSGGERSAAAICIRIAFSFVLTRNLSWIILDEPTHNLDSEAVQTLSEMMQQHLPKLVEQIFVITHDMEMKKAATGSLYVLEREKNSDSATRPVLRPIGN